MSISNVETFHVVGKHACCTALEAGVFMDYSTNFIVLTAVTIYICILLHILYFSLASKVSKTHHG